MSAPSSPTMSPKLSNFADGEWSSPSSFSEEDWLFDSPPTTPLSSPVEAALTQHELLYLNGKQRPSFE